MNEKISEIVNKDQAIGRLNREMEEKRKEAGKQRQTINSLEETLARLEQTVKKLEVELNREVARGNDQRTLWENQRR